MNQKISYNQFFRHYDAVMGDRRKSALFLKTLINEYHPNAETVLELACGTGAVLKYLEPDFQTYGLDVSKGMLSVARKTLQNSKLYNQDMIRFDLNRKFDVIFCVYDSINHLMSFSDWKRVFSRAAKYLNRQGVFIFDINTEHQLRNFVAEPPWVKEFDGNYLIMDIRKGRNGITHWNVKVFECVGEQKFKLYEETIKERSFPVPPIRIALKQDFKEVVTLNSDGKRSSNSKSKIFFVCRKK